MNSISNSTRLDLTPPLVINRKFILNQAHYVAKALVDCMGGSTLAPYKEIQMW